MWLPHVAFHLFISVVFFLPLSFLSLAVRLTETSYALYSITSVVISTFFIIRSIEPLISHLPCYLVCINVWIFFEIQLRWLSLSYPGEWWVPTRCLDHTVGEDKEYVLLGHIWIFRSYLLVLEVVLTKTSAGCCTVTVKSVGIAILQGIILRTAWGPDCTIFS